AKIAVPVTAPRVVEALVGLHGGIVTRTKTDARDLMGLSAGEPGRKNRVDFAGDDAGGFIFSEFQPSFDAMFAFAKLIELLTAADLRLSELAAELPPSHIARALVRCPWEIKGRVMRGLTKEADQVLGNGNDNHVELIDGIKFYQ